MYTERKEIRVYVGTFGKYASGSIAGGWVTPSEYETYDDFIDACKAIHKDEHNPELMFQGYENLPESLYCENEFSEEAFNFCKLYSSSSIDPDALEVYAETFDIDEGASIEDIEEVFNERYIGYFISNYDFACDLVDNLGLLSGVPENIANYFDYEAFGRDLLLTNICEYNGYYFYRY